MAYETKELQLRITGETGGVESSMSRTSSKLIDTSKSVENLSSKATSMGAVMGAVSGVVSTVFNKAISAVTDTIGSAIARVDTLNNANNTFKNMGFNAKDTSDAMTGLKKSIMGLPTSLSDAVSGVELLSASTNDVGKSQKIFSALNDAILGFGGSAASVTNAITQISQAFSNGKIDAQTWNSLIQSGAGPALNALAKQMGITAGALKTGLSDGSISVQAFQDALISMDTKGGGGMASFQAIVKDSTSGIATGWTNAQTAITRGVADIIQSIGSADISKSISDIGSAFEGALKSISGLINFVKSNSTVFTTLAAAIGGVIAAMVIWQAIGLAQELMTIVKVARLGVGALEQLAVTTKLGAVVQGVFNAVMNANPISIIIIAVAGLVAGLVYFFTQTKLGQSIMQSFFKFMQEAFNNIQNLFTTVGNNIRKFFKSVGDVWNSVVKSIVDAFNIVVGTIKKIINDIVTNIVTLFNNVVGFFRQWGATILAVILWPFSLLLGLIIMFWKPISEFFISVGQTISTIFISIVNTVRDIITSVVTTIVNIVVTIFTPVITFFANTFNAISNIITTVFGAVSAWLIARWMNVVDVVRAVVGAIQTVFGVLVGWFTSVWNQIMGVFGAVGNFFGSVFSAAYRSIVTFFTPIVGFFVDMWNRIVGIFGSIGNSIGNAVGSAFKNVMNTIFSVVVGMINGFIGAIDTAIDVINHIPGVKISKISTLAVPHFATGGIIGGNEASGDNTLIAATPGEVVLNKKQQETLLNIANGNSNSSGSRVELTVNIGMYAGMAVEKRQIALELYRELVRAARSQGVQLPMIGAVGAQ